MEKKTQLEIIGQEIKKQLSNKDAVNALLATTFKGLTPEVMQKAMFEGMMRGFKFKDFLEKNVYAIPFKDKYGNQTYSLVQSIDSARKIAMRSGLAGKSKPDYKELENGKIVSCAITVKRNVGGTIGDYTAEVYFDEYDTGKNLWQNKPHTMIAKVAEMHALRSAFPEEMAQVYVEEEMQSRKVEEMDLDIYKEKLEATKTLAELQKVFASLPQQAKDELRETAEELKAKFNEVNNISKSRTVDAGADGKDNGNQSKGSDKTQGRGV